MGCSGSALSNPTPQNTCGNNDSIGMTKDVDGSCFFTTSIGGFCEGTSQKCFGEAQGAGEWAFVGPGAGCGVCSSCNGLQQGNGNGLCGYGSGSCSWAGVKYRCQRTAFNGNPLTCCRRSKFIQGSDLFCFDANDKLRTCQPQHRGFLQPACTGLMKTYCSDDSESVYKQKWIGTASSRDCLRFLQETAGKLNFYGPVIEAMVKRYFLTENHAITSFETDGANHDPFVDTIVQICRDNPGGCDDVLAIKCAGVQRDQLSNNVNLANLCGCFMQDAEYSSLSEFGIDRECDPVCAISTAVPMLDPSTNDPAKAKKCTQSVCVIDDVTINILANSVVGDINFSQACGSCAGNAGTGSCRCYINDVNLTAINSLVKDVNFEQQCGGVPLCYKSAPVKGAPPIQVSCADGAEVKSANPTNAAKYAKLKNTLWIVVAVLVTIAILILLFGLGGEPDDIPAIFIPGQAPIYTNSMIARNRSASKRNLVNRK